MMFYTHTDGVTYSYDLKTDPPEAMYWPTRKIKHSEIKVYDADNSQIFGEVKNAIYDDLEKERKRNMEKNYWGR